ncbi:MAG TPA: hypothetical protein VNO30_34445 [Kofleriaceae bacterium]|nr:hypothetical protein [Kofleriaceae bacterium]
MIPVRELAMLLDGERWRARWRLRGHAPLDADAREGDLVAAAGVVRPLDETLIAPLSGRACVAYRSRIRLGLGGYAPRETMQVRPFVLDLGDEEIVVAGDRAIFGLAPLWLWPLDPGRERSFLARHAVSARDTAWTAGRLSEVTLELGARALVGGTLVLVPRDEPPAHGELGFRDPPPPSQRIVGSRARPLVFLAPGGLP